MSNASVDLPEPETPVITVMPSRGIETSMSRRLCSRALCTTIASRPRSATRNGTGWIAAGSAARPSAKHALPLLLVLDERTTGMRGRASHDVLRRAGGQQLPAGIAALGTEVEDPVGRANHVEVVLDHDQ